MKTLIELFDKEPIYNYLAATVFKPEKVVFVGDGESRRRENIAATESYAKIMKLGCRFERAYANSEDFYDVQRTVRNLIDRERALGNDCTVDVTGGRDLALVAVGSLMSEGTEVIFYDLKTNSYQFLSDGKTVEVKAEIPCNAFIAIAGGTVYETARNMDFASREKVVIRKLIEVYFRYSDVWTKFVKYLQHISKKEGEKVGDSLDVTAPLSFTEAGRFFSSDDEIMRELEKTGAVRNLEIDRKKGVMHFDYMSRDVANLLVNEGIWLELSVYLAGKNSPEFCDVQTGVKFVWDIPQSGESVGRLLSENTPRNEVDVILTRGVRPVFVSCKTRFPANEDLNELYAIKEKFGGGLACAVLATTKRVDKSLPVAERAREMGIEILDERFFRNGTVSDELERIAKKGTV